jgi:hypothetical protein
VEDFVRLAVKGQSPLTGALKLNAALVIPPLQGKVSEKLQVRGTFDITGGHFSTPAIQSHVDELSRKGQGQPKDEDISGVVSRMTGAFALENQSISFDRLTFGVPGADVALSGNYDLMEETLDFHGSLRLAARISQTQSGFKRWLLRPVDPFFAKNGAGTFLRIEITGTRSHPSFGRDSSGKK